MSIDYDRLRALRDEATPGPWLCEKEENEYEVYVGTADFGVITEAVNETDGHLIALAPAMARELLRLRDGVKALVVEKRMWVDQLCDPYEEVLNPDWLAEVGGEEPIGLALEKVCRQLTDLLEGDTE